MASTSRLPRQFILQARRAVAPQSWTARSLPSSARSYSTQQRWSSIRPTIASKPTFISAGRQTRLITVTAHSKNATQEAPNAQAYLNSGAIAGARDLVDVKKVLVIGSGGLAIGQAGEFDYSGMSQFRLVFFVIGGVLIDFRVLWAIHNGGDSPPLRLASRCTEIFSTLGYRLIVRK